MGSLTLDAAGASRAKGLVNEDAYLVDGPHLLVGVFDGLGATTQAAEAAALAADSIRAAYREHHGPDDDGDAERDFLLRAVKGAGASVAADLEDGMTTASVVKVCERPDGRATALVANVGDSRVYRYAAGELRQCTLDDSMFGADFDLQMQLSEVVAPTTMIEFVYFEQRHILDRCLGSPHDTARWWAVDVDEGDLLLAMTDGVTDNLTFSEVREIVGDGQAPPGTIAGRLVEAAYARSLDDSHERSKVDDITAVVARVGRAAS